MSNDDLVERYFDLLRKHDSALLNAGPGVTSQLAAQFTSILQAVGSRFGPRADEANADGLSETIGLTRAVTRVHPSQSLRAASLIFEAALPEVIRLATGARESQPEVVAAVVLNREILDRMASAAAPYVEHLLEKAHSSNHDERHRLSRELHDVAAPAVAVGLQNLELFGLYRDSDEPRADQKLDAARRSLVDALTTIRELSAQSRESIAARGLPAALERMLAALPAGVTTTLTQGGLLDDIPLAYAEELFLVLREAVRNAVDHGRPRTVALTAVRSEEALIASVVDDGTGFNFDAALRSGHHVGIDSMYERADLLGATLTITSSPGDGAAVSIRIPLAHRSHSAQP